MAHDGKVTISTALDNKGFEKGVGQIKGQLGGLGGVVKKLVATIAVAFSAKAVASFAKECVDLGSDLQEVQNVVDVTFSTMNEQVDKFAKNAAVTAGLSETMAKRYVGTFGAMAKSFGFAEGDAYAMSTALTQLSGDVASFYNLSQDAAYTKLKAVFTGETESLKDLGVVMTQAALDSFALQKGFGKTTSEMTEQEKVALRYQFVMEQLSGASGDFLRTSDGWANQTRLLTLQFDQLKATLGQGLINALTPVIQVINELIGSLQALAEELVAVTVELFGDAGNSGSAIGGLAADYGAAAKGAEELEEANKAVKRSLAGFDQIQKIGGNSKNSSTSSAVTIPATVLPEVGDKEATKAQAVVKGFMKKVRKLLRPLLEIDLDPVTHSFWRFAQIAKDFARTTGDALRWVYTDALVPISEWVIEEAAPASVDVLAAEFEAFNEALDPVQRGLRRMLQHLRPLIRFVEDYALVVLEEWEEAFYDLSDTFSEKSEEIEEIFAGIGEICERLWTVMEPIITAMQTKWKGTFEALKTYVVDNIGFIIDALHGLVDFVAGVLTGDWERAWEGFKEAVVQPFNGIISYINQLIAKIAAGYDSIVDIVNRIEIPEWVPGIGGSTVRLPYASPPKIPYLAQGAVLPANKPFLAMVGDQRHGTNVEAPLATIQEAVANVMGDMLPAMMAGFEAVVEEQRSLRSCVEHIEIGDDVIGQAARRYDRKMTMIRGGV